MCHPVGLAAITVPRPGGGSTAEERSLLGALLHRERPAVANQVRLGLHHRRSRPELLEDGVSTFIAEMFKRLDTRSAEQRALPVDEWARLVWRLALAEAVRDVDLELGYPVRRAQRAQQGSGWEQYSDDELLLTESPMIRAARVVMTLRPEEAQTLIGALGGPQRGETRGENRARLRRRRQLMAELRAMLEANL